MKAKAAVNIRVTGRVQGVNFRAFTRYQAGILGVRGWVRNMPDSSVEAFAEGDRTSLEKLVEALRRGPAAARVDNVETNWSDYTGNCEGFRVIR